jgi:hypothetical protein
MKNLIEALEAGKRRGYDEIRVIDSIKYLFQYAIKMDKGVYLTYFLKINESKFDEFEDYAEEEIMEFTEFQTVLKYFNAHGADIQKMTAIKKTLPF